MIITTSMKPKFQEKLLLNYKILIHLSIQKTDKFYKDIGNDFEGKFDTSDYSDESINLYNFKRVNEKV